MPGDGGDTPIKIATQHANLLVLDELLMSHKFLCGGGFVRPEHIDINRRGSQGLTPLHVASRSPDLIGVLLVCLELVFFILPSPFCVDHCLFRWVSFIKLLFEGVADK